MSQNKKSFIPEIQGLRAIAVLCVLLFHIWPDVVSGGYVGVDVFFVVSGYLITALLVREKEAEGTISLTRFYSRRINRLMPVATVVLCATVLTIKLFPETSWDSILRGVMPSALYVKNWHLAQLAVDYLNIEGTPDPLLHFWSLSVEEQFYIFWPTLILGMGFLAKTFNLPIRPFLSFSLVIIVVVSLGFSIHYSSINRDSAYFFTHTRGWEFGLGGVLATTAFTLKSDTFRLIGFAGGLLLILLSSLFFSEQTVFPGFMALLPTAGAVLVILSTLGNKINIISCFLDNKASRYLGDISYSLYLWHWPIVIYFSAISGSKPNIIDGICIIFSSILLSHFSKKWIEDPFRKRKYLNAGYRPFVVATLCLLICLLLVEGARLVLIGDNQKYSAMATSANYPGALAVTDGFKVPNGIEPIPSLANASQDVPEIYNLKCRVSRSERRPLTCEFGFAKSNFHVVLIGDSHAAQWSPALEEIAITNKWKLTVLIKTGCPLLNRLTGDYVECVEWVKAAKSLLSKLEPDIIITSQNAIYKLQGTKYLDASKKNAEKLVATKEVYRELTEFSRLVIVIADTPRMPKAPSLCLVENGRCEVALQDTVHVYDSQIEAAAEVDRVRLIDMATVLCPEKICSPYIGNVFVWRDVHHITATFSKTTAKELMRRIKRLIDDR